MPMGLSAATLKARKQWKHPLATYNSIPNSQTIKKWG